MSNPCQCGRPIQDTGNLCPTCADSLREALTKIADRWPDLELALTASEGGGGERGKTKRAMVASGTSLNEQAVNARRLCADLVWFVVQVIRDDCDTTGRRFDPPHVPADKEAVPHLARWIAQWRISHITHTTSRETAEEIMADTHRAEQATWDAIRERDRRIPTGLPCEQHGTSEQGERIPCEGTMEAKLGAQMPDLVCTADPTHRIPPDVWSRQYWRRSHERMEA